MKQKHQLAVAIAVMSGSLAIADTAPEAPLAIQKVTVNATRMEQSLDEVTRPVAVIEKTALETLQVQSVPEAVRYEPNITVTGGPRADSQTVNIRGLGGNKVLQTVDGVRQVFESGHRPSFFLEPELLQSIEVVKGPASSLWGSGAVAGVLAQNTVNAENLLDPDQNLGGLVKTGYNNNNHQSTTTTAVAGRSDSIDWLASVYYRDSNDIEQGDGSHLDGSAARDQGGLFKLQWQINDDQSLAVNYREAESTGHVPSNGSAAITGTSNYLIDRDQDTRNLAVDYRIDTPSDWLEAQVMAWRNEVDMTESRLSDSRRDHTQLDTTGININNLSRIGKVELLYGVDGYREDFSTRRGGTNRPQPPQATSDIWGAFVQANVPLAEQWQLEFGLRYDEFTTEADNLGLQRHDDDVSASVALTWEAADWLSTTLRYDEAFRAPGAEELYSTGTHFCMFPGFCNTFLPNPQLRSEKAANTEWLVRMHFDALLAADDSLQVNTSVFHNRVDDFIEQIVTGPTFFPVMDPGNTLWTNVGKAKLEGFEVSADYRRQNFGIKLAYGETRGKDDVTGEDLTGIPADTLTADIHYAFLDRQITSGVRVTRASDQDRTKYAANTAGTRYDGYTVTDLYMSWEPSSLSGFKLDVTLNNLTDKDYRVAWEELDQPGKELIVSARYRF